MDDTCCFHDIRRGPKTFVYHVKVIVLSTASGCDVTNCATTLQGFTASQGTVGTKYWTTGIQRNSTSFLLPIDPRIHLVCQCKFRSTFLLIQVSRKTNDREAICEHNSQLSVNCIHIVLFLFAFRSMSLYIDMM